MAEYWAAKAATASPATSVAANITIANGLKENLVPETMTDNALPTVTTLGFLLQLTAGKGSDLTCRARYQRQRYQSVYGNRRVHTFRRNRCELYSNAVMVGRKLTSCAAHHSFHASHNALAGTL
jgi:hypothetical protein